MSKEIRVIISADSSTAERALDRVDKALEGINATSARPAQTAGFRRLGADVREVGEQSRYAREQMRNLSYQMTDIVTGLATGQNPFYVMLQQGGQLRDTFGGTLPALRAVASVFTLANVAGGALAGTLIAVAVAAVQGARESDALSKTLARTGNAAQATAGEFERMVAATSSATRLGAGDVRDLGLALVETGKLSAEAFGPALRAASTFAKTTGKSVEDVRKEFAGLTSNTAQFALEFARKYRGIDADTIALVRSLQAQGRQMEAIRVASDAVAESMAGRQQKSLYAVVRGWDDLTAAVGRYWEKLKGAFRDETPEGRLEELLENQRQREAARAAGAAPNAGIFRNEEREKAQIRQLQGLLGARRKASEQLADLQAKDDRERERDTAAFQSTLAANDKAASDLRLERTRASLDQARTLYRDSFRRGEVDAKQYQDALFQIDMAGIDAREAAARAALAADLRVKPSTPQETEAQTARVLQMERELVDLQRERAQLQDDERTGKRRIDPLGTDLKAGLDEAEARFREFADRREDAALQAGYDLIESNKQLSVELIKNDEQRAAAQLELEREVLLKRLDLDRLSVEERKKVQAAFDEWSRMRGRQLADDLKPGWRRMVDEWADMQQLMRKASDETWTGVLSNAEDAFVQLMTTGKLSFDSLVRDFIAAQAKLEFRKFFGGLTTGKFYLPFQDAFGQAGNLFSSFVGMLGGGRAYGGDAHRGRLHPINERGVPEVLTVRGQDYLATGASSGKVTPMKPTSRGVTATLNVTNYIDSRTDASQVAQIAAQTAQASQQQLLDMLRADRVL